ncbi:DUF1702 family protein [Actinomadura darangshiensis]|uniref:DUF1702 family protein n=1 Tax=Actinomadura darangshiensis TaxID=705336 RepID=A0A4V6PEW5_9ACTN|nr:DUF1702 family protein [Actinomadura darangshiensis]TDD83507.1 DUF1702 family protein [Actinomadura darangshiensis]
MNGSLRRLRSRILTPSISATKMSVRGFRVKDYESQAVLETIGRTFLTGYAAATRVPSMGEVAAELADVPTRFRGFAYEGAAMGLAMLDGLPGGGKRRVAEFLDGAGRDHVYMVYVGVGWAAARLPGFRRSRLAAPDPLLRWLALDGYGFHQAYFRTGRYVDGQAVDPVSWPVYRAPYAGRAVDQGIGRALWFVCGTDPRLVADRIEAFAEDRRGDLYSGAGLAAGYAGGADEKELRVLRERAGRYRPQLAQGCAFAAEARLRAELLVPHVELATEVLCSTTPQEAARVCTERMPARPADSAADARAEVPAYEAWRRDVAAALVPGQD